MVETMNQIVRAHECACDAFKMLQSVHITSPDAEATIGVARSSLLQAMRQIEKAVEHLLPAALAAGFALPGQPEPVKPAAEPKSP